MLLSVWVCPVVASHFRNLRELYVNDFHNPASAQTAELGLTRGTCLVASRLDFAAVAMLLWFRCVAAVCLEMRRISGIFHFAFPERTGLLRL